MASPFPGMDPYLERHWGDVHHSLITYARDQLREVLPKDLRARVEERVFVESPEGLIRKIVPDVRVIEMGRRKKQAGRASSVAVAEPFIVEIDEPVTEGYIEIIDASSGGRVVTVIEVLSPAKKVAGDGEEKYLQERQELRDAKVSLVEIDLIRAGNRLLPFPFEKLPRSSRTTYQVWVRRGWQATKVEVYRVPLRKRLPVVRVPLRETDEDAPLDLQALVDQCYRNGDYEDDIDYQVDPDPPLSAEDARWADGLLRQTGRRVRPQARRPNRPNGRRR